MSEEELPTNKKITDQLKPFLDCIGNMDVESTGFKVFKQVFHEYRKKYKRAEKIGAFLMKDFEVITKFSAKEEIHWLFAYLGLIESLGSCVIDLIVMLLVACGRDFHIEYVYETPHIRHATSMSDLKRQGFFNHKTELPKS